MMKSFGARNYTRAQGYSKSYFPDFVIKDKDNNIFAMEIKVNSGRFGEGHQKEGLLELKQMGLRTGVLRIRLKLTIEKIEWKEL